MAQRGAVSSQKVLIETVGLSMHFGGVRALDNVSLKIRQGELRCLIGPNGAGKSTFFKCLCGINRPTAGQVFLGMYETTDYHPHEIADLGVGIKTQVPSVFDQLSVYENLWLSAAKYFSRQQIDERCMEQLELLSLTDIKDRQLGNLAHGQRQMVELGMVMIRRPWLILLDEPAAGLTGDEIERMRQAIFNANNTATLIVVEHDMQFIRSIAEQVTVFHQGQVLIDSDLDTVMNDQQVRDVYLGKNG